MVIGLIVLAVFCTLLLLLNIYQFLAQRSALRIGEIKDDEDGISRIAVAAAARDDAGAPKGEFIPYTDRAIGWLRDYDASTPLRLVPLDAAPAPRGTGD